MRRPVQGIVVALLLVAPRETAAEWQFKPFLGVTFAPSTTYRGDVEFAAGLPSGDPEFESGSANLTFGAAVVLIGDVFGVEGDFSHAPGFFQAGDLNLVRSSSTQTLTGNLVVAVPRRLSRYTLRPYALAGLGLMRLRSEDLNLFFPIHETRTAIDFGGGATGFLNERVGVSWELRYFRAIGGKRGNRETSPLTVLSPNFLSGARICQSY